MQIGIRLHDVNSKGSAEEKSLAGRVKTAAAEGFGCIHLALDKVLPGAPFYESALTEGLGSQVRRICESENMDVAVLGCYLNLAHPDPAALAKIQGRYRGTIRVAALCGASVVGTETGAPNAQYAFDADTHGQAALLTFMRNLEPVLDCAESYGVSLAIEPVYKHIVWNADRALEVLRGMQSKNLRIILDPVNLLSVDNVDERERVILDAADKLCEHIAIVHIKDFVRRDNELVSVAAGCGEMDYTNLLRFVRENKPFVQATLENTDNANAVAARELIERVYGY